MDAQIGLNRSQMAAFGHPMHHLRFFPVVRTSCRVCVARQRQHQKEKKVHRLAICFTESPFTPRVLCPTGYRQHIHLLSSTKYADINANIQRFGIQHRTKLEENKMEDLWAIYTQ